MWQGSKRLIAGVIAGVHNITALRGMDYSNTDYEHTLRFGVTVRH